MDILPHLASAIEPTQGFAENRSPAQSEPEIARAEVESKGSMNMRAVFLHVMGDALGNLGVIVCGLVIWLTHWKHRFVLDPIVSLVITGIIFTSALPLVRSAASILLQGVPDAISLSTVRGALLAIPGVLSVHDLHIWQLSESELVASVHVLAIRPTRSISMVNDSRFSLEEMADGVVVQKHMSLSAEVRNTMYAYGIRSSTVQLEYVSEGSENDGKVFKQCPLARMSAAQSAGNAE
ncbi:hypothetical protein FRB98_003382 [Tulasnella sp. 332]|nr:hypothetical protein FRB98_003382 [Tulasnella sp. 332]